MKGIRTVEKFIDHMWKTGKFSDEKNVKKIQDIASSEGYTFSKSDIREVLDKSEIIVRSGKCEPPLCGLFIR